jgi:hypothetical protein
VSPGDGPAFLRNLSARELDFVDPDYLKFVNPGDLRIADQTCGQNSPKDDGMGCHQDTIQRVETSTMAHTSGEITVARYRAGAQDTPDGLLGATALVDPNYDETRPASVPTMDQFDPDPPDLATPDVGEIQDDYMVKSCFRCHLWDFGENKFVADYRSSGCSACHMVYNDAGFSESLDPTIPKNRPPHPAKHVLTKAVPTNQCTHCHYRGGRIGLSYQGYRERGGAGYNPESPEVLGVTQHGHDPTFYLTDEDTTNSVDETPPDIHFERGLHCIDCHTEHDVHGDGHIYGDTQVVVEVRCETCHGTIDAESDFLTARGVEMSNLSRDANGDVWLESKIDGELHPVKQIARSVDPSSPEYSLTAKIAMGRDPDTGFSHADGLACYTCHSSWYPSCYGCHVTMDYSKDGRVQTTDAVRPGQPAGARKWVELNDLVLMRDVYGRIAPSMPSERFFLSAVGTDGQPLFDRRVRRDKNGQLGFGQRTMQPHTVRTDSSFSLCEKCHILSDQSNLADVRVVVGFGSDRFVDTDGDGNQYRFDAIQTEAYEPLVNIGHDEPQVSRPLEQEIVEMLLTVPVDQ